MSQDASNIIIGPVDVFWEIESKAFFELASLVNPDGTSFDLFDTDGAAARVFYDLDAGSTPPATPAGGRLIEVDTVTGDSATTLATLTAAAIDADGKFSSTSSGTVVTVDSAAIGQVTDPVDVDSGVVITVCYKGKNLDLGLLQDPPTPNFNVTTFDVTAQQTGTTNLAKLVTGFEGDVETVLLETTKSRYAEFLEIYGETFLPGGGTSVTGAGTGIIGKNMLSEAGRLRFTPRNASLPAELGYDVTARLAIPVPGSISFSGEEPRTLTVAWTFLADLEATRADLDFYIIGDTSQTGVL